MIDQQHCDLPRPNTSVYDVYQCGVCRQWWKLDGTIDDDGNFKQWWTCTTRFNLIRHGLNPQCRSFLKHNR